MGMRFKHESCECGQVHFIFVGSSGRFPPPLLDYICPELDQMFTCSWMGRQKQAIEHVHQPQPEDIVAKPVD
jgi:hypothetical protein